MGTINSGSGEKDLRGTALDGAEQPNSVEHTAYERKRNPDAVVRTDGTEDTLYNDGLDLEDDSRSQTDTDGHSTPR
jgi:hypothetical protein